MRWLWPSGLAGRIALVLGVMLIGVQLLTLPFLLREQSSAATELYQGSTVERIAAIIQLFEPLPSTQRRELLPVISSPFLILEMFHTVTVQEADAQDERELAYSLSSRLQREVIIKQVTEEPGALSRLLSTRQQIAIWVPLSDGSWLRFSTSSALPASGWVAHVTAQLLLVCLVLVIFAIVAARQITRPIHTFVAAAERLGTDVNAPPIAEQGSAELRRVSRVFNTMQQRLQRYVDDRTRMLAAISHDLRTSLTRLRLRTHFITDPEQQRKAELDLDQMDAMLASTLAFARDDAAQETPVSVDLAMLLQTLCDDQSDLGEDVSYNGPESYTLHCRPMALQRAIGNVLGNAVSYGEQVQVVFEPGQENCYIRIKDRGPGIPQDQLEAVFEPFVRLDPSRNRSTGGTGLGLSIARSVMRSHGGDVTLANQDVGGLEVTLSLADLRKT
jgi:signal transduction histidine kinase